MNFLKQLTKVASFLSICCFLSAAPFSGQAAVSSVLAWGDNAAGQTNTPPDMTNIVAISAGRLHTIALRSDGNMIGWGDSYYGLTNAPAGVSNVIAIAAGDYFNMVLTPDGQVTVWGYNSWQQTNVPPGLTDVTAIAAGSAHCLALRSDGSLVAWGRNYEHQTEVPIGLKSVMAICAGAYSSMALLSDGRTVAWGSGTTAVSAATNNIVGIYAGNFIVRLDGSVVDRIGQTVSVSNVLMIANGGYHTLALSRDGVVTGWGANLYGSLDIPANTTNAVGIAAGGFHSVAMIGGPSPTIVSPPQSRHVFDGSDTLLNVGAIGGQPLTYQWFKEGEMLEGATNSSFLLTNFQAFNSGGYFVTVSNIFGSVTSSVAALTLNSSAPVTIRQPQNIAASWGNTVTFGVSVIGSSPLSYQWQFNGVDITAQKNSTLTLTNVGVTDAGSYSVVITNHQGAAVSSSAVLSVAPIASWGAGLSNANTSPNYGQSIVPATATNIVAIAAGGFHTLALQSDRKPIAWGWNGNGQTTFHPPPQILWPLQRETNTT